MSNAMESIGAMTQPWLTGTGKFTPQGEYEAHPPANSSVLLGQRNMNAQAAMHAARNFGGGVLPQGMGMMAGILPAALKIQESQQMREVAEKYYEKYIKDFNKKYGFSQPQIEELVTEFNDVTKEICNLIPDPDMKEMYKKYIDSYPTMYLSMIPAEALQTKLAVKCVTENKNLRTKIEQMSSSVSSLVKNLTDLQISAGIPPIVNLMFESMPDPLTAITDPMYHKYNDAIVTYHHLLDDQKIETARERIEGTNDKDINGNPATTGSPALQNEQLLRLEPIKYLQGLHAANAPHTTVQAGGGGEAISAAKIKDLLEVMTNMQTQSGCQPFGEEWNHQGPTPAMNPAMCLGDKDKFQPGNPRHNQGRTNLYHAKRDANGNAHWEQSGQIPALSAGGPQMAQHMPQAMQQPDPWAGQRHMPGIDPRPSQQQSYHPSMQQAMPNFNTPYSKPRRSSKGTKKAKGGSKGTKKKRATA